MERDARRGHLLQLRAEDRVTRGEDRPAVVALVLAWIIFGLGVALALVWVLT